VEDVETSAWFAALAEESRALGAAAGVEVECTQRGLPSHIAFDGEAVRRAVLNLVVNALRHSGSARIEIAATVEPGDVLLMSVADHGRGVPVREREAIFEPFARLAGSETTPGAGLGLAIVREIALAHRRQRIGARPRQRPGRRVRAAHPRAR
jgi:signal transduction histidine kinase